MSYLFQDKTYDDFFSIAKDLYLTLDWAKKVGTKDFLSFIESQDPQKAKKISNLLLVSIPDDVLLFKVGEILNPYMSFRFHGHLFQDYEELGKTLLSFSPNPDPTLQSILRHQLVSEHMKTTLYASAHPEDYEKIKEIEILAREDVSYAYYSMGYFLTKSTSIIYDHVLYKDIYNLTYFLAKKEKDLSTLGSYLSFSSLLKAYSQYSPDGKNIEDYLHLCENVDSSQKALETFLEQRKIKIQS